MPDYHVFLSYTSREEEVQWIQPLIERYCHELWQWANSNGIHIFYDHFSIPQREYTDAELRNILEEHVSRSDLFTSFLSPGYIESEWCRFEVVTKAEEPDPVIHSIYWKPNIWRYVDVFPYGEPQNPEAFFRQYVQRFKWTDVTFAYAQPSCAIDAALQCARDSARFIAKYHPNFLPHSFVTPDEYWHN